MLHVRDVAQLVAHLLWEQGVGSSSLPIPTHLSWCDALDTQPSAGVMHQEIITDVSRRAPEIAGGDP